MWNIISTKCTENEIYKVFLEAFNLEASFGTNPTEAFFLIVSGSHPKHDSKYEPEICGSWVVESRESKQRYIYDGKDFNLMVLEGKEHPKWQSYFKTNENVDEVFFKKLFH